MTNSPARGTGVVLITGVTGFLGKVLLHEVISRRKELGVARVVVIVRARGEAGASRRFDEEVVRSPCLEGLPSGWTDLVSVVEADLEDVVAMRSVASVPAVRAVTSLVHAAASVRFDLPLADAARANVHATRHLLALAKGLPWMRRFVYVSTAYVTPWRPGPIAEDLVVLPESIDRLLALCDDAATDAAALLAHTGHPNSYTLTKAIAEHLIAAERGEMPVTIVRPSIVTATRARPFPGWLDSRSGYAGFVMAVGSGVMRALACDPTARLDLIPVDDTAERIARSLVDDSAPFAIRHATVGAARSATVRWHWFDAQRYYRKHPVLFRPRSVFIGPHGLAFRVADLLAHEIPARIAGMGSPAARRQAARVRERIARLNRDFAYFTTRTFEFESTWPMDNTFTAESFHETVLVGVRNHLLSGIVASGQRRGSVPPAQ